MFNEKSRNLLFSSSLFNRDLTIKFHDAFIKTVLLSAYVGTVVSFYKTSAVYSLTNIHSVALNLTVTHSQHSFNKSCVLWHWTSLLIHLVLDSCCVLEWSLYNCVGWPISTCTMLWYRCDCMSEDYRFSSLCAVLWIWDLVDYSRSLKV